MALYIMTLAEMKAILQIEDSVDNTGLTMWLEGIQGRFDMHCRRRFLYSESDTETFNGGTRALTLARWPVETVSSIVVDTDQDWSNADLILEESDYRLNHRRGRILFGVSGVVWPDAPQSIRVVYAGGFVKSDGTACTYVYDYELQALKRNFMLQANFEWRNRQSLGISQVSQGGVSVQQGAQVSLALKFQTLLPEVETGLQPFVRTV